MMRKPKLVPGRTRKPRPNDAHLALQDRADRARLSNEFALAEALDAQLAVLRAPY